MKVVNFFDPNYPADIYAVLRCAAERPTISCLAFFQRLPVETVLGSPYACDSHPSKRGRRSFVSSSVKSIFYITDNPAPYRYQAFLLYRFWPIRAHTTKEKTRQPINVNVVSNAAIESRRSFLSCQAS